MFIAFHYFINFGCSLSCADLRVYPWMAPVFSLVADWLISFGRPALYSSSLASLSHLNFSFSAVSSLILFVKNVVKCSLSSSWLSTGFSCAAIATGLVEPASLFMRLVRLAEQTSQPSDAVSFETEHKSTKSQSRLAHRLYFFRAKNVSKRLNVALAPGCRSS